MFLVAEWVASELHVHGHINVHVSMYMYIHVQGCIEDFFCGGGQYSTSYIVQPLGGSGGKYTCT